jgi:hypothetical protein
MSPPGIVSASQGALKQRGSAITRPARRRLVGCPGACRLGVTPPVASQNSRDLHGVPTTAIPWRRDPTLVKCRGDALRGRYPGRPEFVDDGRQVGSSRDGARLAGLYACLAYLRIERHVNRPPSGWPRMPHLRHMRTATGWRDDATREGRLLRLDERGEQLCSSLVGGRLAGLAGGMAGRRRKVVRPSHQPHRGTTSYRGRGSGPARTKRGISGPGPRPERRPI